MNNFRFVMRMPKSIKVIFIATVLLSMLSFGTPADADGGYSPYNINVRYIRHDVNGTVITDLIYTPNSNIDYVSNTLCNEWFCSWNDNALWAGAIMIRGNGYWEMRRRSSQPCIPNGSGGCQTNCHGNSDSRGFWDTQSSDYDYQNDHAFIPNSATPTSTQKTYDTSNYHSHPAGSTDYAYLIFGSDIENETQYYATGVWPNPSDPRNGQTYDWRGIIHQIYDNTSQGSCGYNQAMGTGFDISPN